MVLVSPLRRAILEVGGLRRITLHDQLLNVLATVRTSGNCLTASTTTTMMMTMTMTMTMTTTTMTTRSRGTAARTVPRLRGRSPVG
jgi:hypothetical protein